MGVSKQREERLDWTIGVKIWLLRTTGSVELNTEGMPIGKIKKKGVVFYVKEDNFDPYKCWIKHLTKTNVC